MGKIHFESDGKNLPAISLAFYQSATIILRELAQTKGNGPWFELLKEEIKASMKGGLPEGIPADDEAAFIKAGLDAVDLVFDRIKFG